MPHRLAWAAAANATTPSASKLSTTASPGGLNHDTLNLILAVILSVGSAAANSLGLVMQKRFKQLSCLWILGNLVFQSGSLLMAAALVFGEQLLVAPLGALVMVFNIPFSRCFLGEAASPWDVVGSVFIMAGVVCVAIFGPVSDVTPKPWELLDLLARPAFVGVASSIVVYVVVVAVVGHFMVKKLVAEHVVIEAFTALQEPLAAGGGTGDGEGDGHGQLGGAGESDDWEGGGKGDTGKKDGGGGGGGGGGDGGGDDESMNLPLESFRAYFLFFGYATLMAMSSGFLMCAAQLLEILVIDAVNNKTGPDIATNPLFWGPLAVLLVFLVLQSKFANNGLKLFSALTLVPTIQLFNQIGVAAIGAVYFEEFAFYATHQLYAGLFALALALLFSGLIIILVCRHRALSRRTQAVYEGE